MVWRGDSLTPQPGRGPSVHAFTRLVRDLTRPSLEDGAVGERKHGAARRRRLRREKSRRSCGWMLALLVRRRALSRRVDAVARLVRAGGRPLLPLVPAVPRHNTTSHPHLFEERSVDAPSARLGKNALPSRRPGLQPPVGAEGELREGGGRGDTGTPAPGLSASMSGPRDKGRGEGCPVQAKRRGEVTSTGGHVAGHDCRVRTARPFAASAVCFRAVVCSVALRRWAGLIRSPSTLLSRRRRPSYPVRSCPAALCPTTMDGPRICGWAPWERGGRRSTIYVYVYPYIQPSPLLSLALDGVMTIACTYAPSSSRAHFNHMRI
jgi:hypothetical protein